MDTKMRKKNSHSSSSFSRHEYDGNRSKRFGCRVRFPIYSCSFVKKVKEDEEDEFERENKKEIRVLKKEEEKRVDRMLLDPKFSVNKEIVGSSEQTGTELSALSEKKEEDQSLNLGMGVGLFYLLSKSTTELNKMVELRKEMETLLVDIKNEIKKKNKPMISDDSNICGPVSISISGGNENTSNCCVSSFQEEGELDKSVNEIDVMEAELEVELERLQFSVESNKFLPPIRTGEMEISNGANDFTDSFDEYDNIDEEEKLEDEDRNYENFDGGVCPFELERRLQEVLESRQKEKIEELESALEFAERKLNEKDREICWWRDTARLVTQHKDDTHFR